ncbi:hypothetical protein RIF29_14866 [Crotalaria pallida]|uniref:Uncharacterized protein n=1 Tax=Crotalaria pallida TaxID=3830 RepID=A0AAN9IAP5_CROPI
MSRCCSSLPLTPSSPNPSSSSPSTPTPISLPLTPSSSNPSSSSPSAPTPISRLPTPTTLLRHHSRRPIPTTLLRQHSHRANHQQITASTPPLNPTTHRNSIPSLPATHQHVTNPSPPPRTRATFPSFLLSQFQPLLPCAAITTLSFHPSSLS